MKRTALGGAVKCWCLQHLSGRCVVVGRPQDRVAAVGDVSDFPDEVVNQEDQVDSTHQVALHNAVARDLRCSVHAVTL